MSYPAAPPPGQGASPYPGGAGSVCPRHPDRVSYVRCQRCGRPACSECQRPAAVGVHCVDCVAEAAQSARPQRSILGAIAPRGNAAVITLTLLAINVLLFVGQQVNPQFVNGNLALAPIIAAAEPWRMLTTAFLHGGILHLALNMYALWIIGSHLEQMLGRWRYITLYFLSAFGGSVAVLLLTPFGQQWVWTTVGASGAVFGLFAGIAIVLKRVGGNYSQILIIIGINVVFSFTGNISWQAHLGGMAVGAMLSYVYAFLPKHDRLRLMRRDDARKAQTNAAVAASIAVGVILVGAAIVRLMSVGLL